MSGEDTAVAAETAAIAPSPTDASLGDFLARLGDRWTVAALSLLAATPQPLGGLRRTLAGITQRALMLTLRALERDGLIERRADAGAAGTVHYALTARGEALLPVLTGLTDWARLHRDGILRSRQSFDAAQAERAALLPRDLGRGTR